LGNNKDLILSWADQDLIINKLESDPDEVLNKLSTYWENRYSNNNWEEGGLGNDLQNAYYESSPYIEHFENIFSEANLNTELAFIYIPESHFKLDEYSSGGALGS